MNKKIIDEDTASKARIVDNLGFAYFKKGRSKKGLLLMQQSFEAKNKIDDPYGYIESNLHLSEYYLKLMLKNQFNILNMHMKLLQNSIVSMSV